MSYGKGISALTRVEVRSWLFAYKVWNELSRMPTPDKGFEEGFREYLYSKVKFDRVSDIRDTGFGLSYSTLSNIPHELDVVCAKHKDLFVFELKHFEVSDLTKEIIFTFLGKVMDFHFKNAENLSACRITMFLLTINRNVHDSIRKLCLTYGIRLIEPSLMTLEAMDYYTRDLYQRIPEGKHQTKARVERLIKRVSKLKEDHMLSFTDIFRSKDGKIELELESLQINWSDVLRDIKECYSEFEGVRKTWNAQKS